MKVNVEKLGATVTQTWTRTSNPLKDIFKGKA